MAAINFMARLLKGPAPQFDHDEEFKWQEDAACRFQPWSLFEVARRGDRITDGMSDWEIDDLNRANLMAARKICNKCPVLELCREAAEPEDFIHTMRAGIFPKEAGRLRLERSNDPSEPCKNNHPLSSWSLRTTQGPGGWYCRDCRKSRAKSTPLAKPGRKPKPPAEPKPPAKTGRKPNATAFRDKLCGAGLHDEWTLSSKTRASGNPEWYCAPCKRDRDRESKRKKRAAAKVEG